MTHLVKRLLIISSLGLLWTSQAQPVQEGFRTPTGNTHCLTDSNYDGTVILRCDILRNEAFIPAKPRDCEFDYGNTFGMGVRGRSSRWCVSDTVADPSNPVLAYGRVWRANGFTCDMSTLRLRCVNRDGHGFELARKRQVLF
jgi:hypothetical protein